MRTRRAALAAIAAAASLALTLSACGQSSEGGSEETTGSAKGGTIGIAMPTKSSERWIADGKNVVKDLESKGYKTKLVYGEDDPDQQVSQIENMITQGVKALIIAAIDNKSLNNVLQQAKDAKHPGHLLRPPDPRHDERRLLRVVRQREGRRAPGHLHRRQARPEGRQEGPVQHRAVRRLQRRQQHQVLLRRRDERPAAVHRQEAARRQVRPDQAQPGHHPALGRRHRAEAHGRHPDRPYKSEQGRRGALAVRRHLHRHPVRAEVGRLRLREPSRCRSSPARTPSSPR